MRLHALIFLLLVSCLNSASAGYTPDLRNETTEQIVQTVTEINVSVPARIEKIEKQQEEILQQQSFIMSQVDLINSRIEKMEVAKDGK